MQPRWMRDAAELVTPPPPGGPAVLVFDIETSPEANWTWSRYQANTIRNLRPWYILSFVYTWLGTDTYQFVGQNQNPKYRPDRLHGKPNRNQDRWVVAQLWHLFDHADVLVAHNGDKFDIRKANARFLTYHMDPPSPYRSIDTLKEARRYGAFASNRLDDLARQLLHDEKVAHMGMATWFGCMQGDEQQWARMEEYNLHDVVLLERLYRHLMPWIGTPGKANPGVNASAYGGPAECPKVGCGGTRLIARGYRTTAAGLRYKKWQCNQCRGYSTSRYAERDRTTTETRVK